MKINKSPSQLPLNISLDELNKTLADLLQEDCSKSQPFSSLTSHFRNKTFLIEDHKKMLELAMSLFVTIKRADNADDLFLKKLKNETILPIYRAESSDGKIWAECSNLLVAVAAVCCDIINKDRMESERCKTEAARWRPLI